jgi:O-antigen ligase
VLIVLGGVVAAAAGYVFGLDGGAQGRGRIVVGEQEGNPNALGRSLLLPLALAIVGLVGSRDAVRKAAAAACLGVIGVGVYISMSRGALVAMIVTISVLLYRTRARKEIFVATLVLLALTAAMPEQLYRRITSLFTGEDVTGSGRTGLWALGLEALLDGFAAFGAGLGNTPDVYGLYVLRNEGGFGFHNAYLSLWVELGIVGMALLFAAFASHLLVVRRAAAAGHSGLVLGAAEAACFGVLASIFFGDYFWVKSFWLPWILVTWAIHCERESSGHAVSEGGLTNRSSDMVSR